MSAPARPRPAGFHAVHTPAVAPLGERELDELQSLLDRVPEPLEPLDASMLDGFLCGVLVQPQRVPDSRWLPHVTDADARPLPAGFDATRLHALARRRHAELDEAIARRRWFDPWVFELEPPSLDAVYPWVAGFATALEFFPALMRLDAQVLTEPLALLYRHLDPDDLEDADDLLEEIDSLEPPTDMTEAVEGLVRATLLLADVTRPIAAPPGAKQQRPKSRRR
jgi:uncharacterized protein